MSPSRDGNIGAVSHHIAGDRETTAEDVIDGNDSSAYTAGDAKNDKAPAVDPLPEW